MIGLEMTAESSVPETLNVELVEAAEQVASVQSLYEVIGQPLLVAM